MPHTCKVTGCQNRKKKGDDSVSFYRIPHKRQRRKLWIAALNMEHLSEEELENVRVCSHHFVHGKSSVFPGHPDYAPSVFNCKEHHQLLNKTHTEESTPQTEADEQEVEAASIGSMSDGEDVSAVSDDESGSESGNIQRPDDVKMIEIKEEVEETERDEGQWIGVKALQQLVEVAEEARKMKEAKLMKPPSMADQLKEFAGAIPTTKPLRQIVPNGISPEDWTTAMENLNVYLVQMYCCKLCENKFGSMSQPVILAHLKEVHQIEWNKAESATTIETPKRTETTRTKRTPSIDSIRQSVLKSALDEACRKTSTDASNYPNTCSTNFPALSFKNGLTTIVNTQSDITSNFNQTMQAQSEGQTTMTDKLGPSSSKDEVVVCRHCDEICNSMQEYWAHCHNKHLLTDVSVDD